tara:strand:- start:116354 stop:116500 length:147 start_codon:yes stop_codon:yes gene_type:complete
LDSTSREMSASGNSSIICRALTMRGSYSRGGISVPVMRNTAVCSRVST